MFEGEQEDDWSVDEECLDLVVSRFMECLHVAVRRLVFRTYDVMKCVRANHDGHNLGEQLWPLIVRLRSAHEVAIDALAVRIGDRTQLQMVRLMTYEQSVGKWCGGIPHENWVCITKDILIITAKHLFPVHAHFGAVSFNLSGKVAADWSVGVWMALSKELVECTDSLLLEMDRQVSIVRYDSLMATLNYPDNLAITSELVDVRERLFNCFVRVMDHDVPLWFVFEVEEDSCITYGEACVLAVMGDGVQSSRQIQDRLSANQLQEVKKEVLGKMVRSKILSSSHAGYVLLPPWNKIDREEMMRNCKGKTTRNSKKRCVTPNAKKRRGRNDAF